MKLIKAIVHILDKDSGNLILSQGILNEKDPVIEEYLEKIIRKIENSDYKELELSEENKVTSFVRSENNFVEESNKLAIDLFESMKNNEKILSGDLLIFIMQDEAMNTVHGIVKLDHSIKFSHEIDYVEDTLVAKIIRNKAILPSPTQSIHDAILISGRKCKILEKEYISSNGSWILSKNFLEIDEKTVSVKESVKSIKRTVESISEKYNNDTFQATSIAQKALYESIEMDSTIDNEYIAEKVFNDNSSARSDFINELRVNGVNEVIKVPNSKLYEKKYKRQKIKLGNGIELTLPVELLKNGDVVEFKVNSDGTTSVIIKNVEKIMNNFS